MDLYIQVPNYNMFYIFSLEHLIMWCVPDTACPTLKFRLTNRIRTIFWQVQSSLVSNLDSSPACTLSIENEWWHVVLVISSLYHWSCHLFVHGVRPHWGTVLNLIVAASIEFTYVMMWWTCAGGFFVKVVTISNSVARRDIKTESFIFVFVWEINSWNSSLTFNVKWNIICNNLKHTINASASTIFAIIFSYIR